VFMLPANPSQLNSPRRLGWSVLLLSLAQIACPTLVFAQSTIPGQKPDFQLINQASYNYTGITSLGRRPPNPGDKWLFKANTNVVKGALSDRLIDPFGRITGCSGEELTDYTGFNIALYDADPADPTGTNLGNLTQLTQTEFPDVRDNGIPKGLQPNNSNVNPFYLVNGEGGKYNFLFDPNKGQLDTGRSYILVANPPRNSIYSPRRIKIVINQRIGDVVSYTATALDGKPISTQTGQVSIGGVLKVGNAEATELILSALDLVTDVCQAQELQIVKVGDRATAEPGDTAIYRLSVRNLSSASVKDLTITDDLPVGFRFKEGSAQAEAQGIPVQVTAKSNGDKVTFEFPTYALPAATIGQNRVLNIAYAAVLTPDAIRGNGQNLASVVGLRTDNGNLVKDGPASHRMRIQRGIVADCGTILGRVFEDKNFDGEQQTGEPGIPNAVVFLEDGNRITTDNQGLFSVANVLPGYRTGVLDLSSIPGYTLAPNQKFQERNSQSRLVHLAPSSLVRMNFAVTPSSREVGP
jgi:uncharacterized repeat protein (TIGR01451 family)